MGDIRGFSCARKVIAHMMYMDTAERRSVDLQMLVRVRQDPNALLPRGEGLVGLMHVRLVLSFGREYPGSAAKYSDDYGADEGCPAMHVSFRACNRRRDRRQELDTVAGRQTALRFLVQLRIPLNRPYSGGDMYPLAIVVDGGWASAVARAPGRAGDQKGARASVSWWKTVQAPLCSVAGASEASRAPGRVFGDARASLWSSLAGACMPGENDEGAMAAFVRANRIRR